MKIGCVDVGGGLRDVYGAGVFDYLMDNDIYFDYCIGVSAGSANCTSFIARQRGRNKMFYLDYMTRKEGIGLGRYVKTGSFVDLNYIYATLSNSDGENPLDYEAFIESPTEFKIVATDAKTGKPVYFDKIRDTKKDDYKILMASSCLPVFCKPVAVGGRKYFDGGLSDPVPFKKAFEDGCDKVVIILTLPLGTPINQKRNASCAKMIRRKYPKFAESMYNTAEVYKNQVEEALRLEEDGKALIVAPDDIMGLSTFTKEFDKLGELYNKGYKDAEKIKEFLNEIK